ncbi:MAG: hypothetical protein J6Z20_02280 [Bacteroidales bacterium]|jgi:hypothetical protein|nr:hypothetical protein [Bacteroidales bacterium]
MKRIIIITIAVLMAMPVFAQGAQYRKKLREIKKEGWELYGSSKTMKEVLRTHYEALDQEGVFEVFGSATGIKSESIGQQMAWNNASINYVQQAGSFLRGRIATDNHAGGGYDGEFNNFYSAYETLLQKEIRGELRPSYTLVRHNADGSYQVMSYFIVNEEAAMNARVKAMELAASESEAAQQIAVRISEFVKEGFDE